MVGRLELQDDFKEQAEWRREKAKQCRPSALVGQNDLIA